MEHKTEENITTQCKAITEDLSFKKNRTGNGDLSTPVSAHPSCIFQPTLQRFHYYAGSKKRQQSVLVESNEELCDTATAHTINGLDLFLLFST